MTVATAAQLPARLLRLPDVRFDAAAIAAWLLPFLLIVYLALSNGGYDVIERSQAGIIIWWIVLVGTAVGALPIAGGTRAGRIMLGVLAAFAAWTALSLSWTESAERTSVELGRVAAYLGFFALALAVQGEGRWRQLLNGVTAGIAVVAGIAVLSRVQPTWFPKRVSNQFLHIPDLNSRLAYPLNYSSGMGALAAIGLPLLLSAASSARTLLGQAMATAALPLVALMLWLTTSGQSIPPAVVGIVVFLCLASDRLPKVATLLIAACGAVILCAAVDQRHALDHGLVTPAAQQQGHELLVIVFVVCCGVALVQTGIGLAVRYAERPAWLVIPRQRAVALLAVAFVILGVTAVAAGLPHQINKDWQQFKGRKNVSAHASRSAQILDVSSSGRYQFWLSAADANATDPWQGIGPGTFQFWWAKHGSYGGFVRNAHSLYMETLAELGIIGLVLIIAVVGGAVLIGSVRSLRGPPGLRVGLAGATAAMVAFALVAGVDWHWQIGVLPAIFFMLAGVAVVGGGSARSHRRPDVPSGSGGVGKREAASRLLMVGLSGLALIAIAVPLAGATYIRQSQDSAATNQFGPALSDARAAQSVQPYAATPRIQEALVLELLGRYGAAVRDARAAASDEPTNWSNWFVLSRLEARTGNAEAAVRAYRRARSLNPRSHVFVR